MKKIGFYLLYLTSFQLYAQQTVQGVVLDANTKQPLPFANVITNLNQGTITNLDGTFELDKNDGASNLTVSYVGYKTKVVPLSPQGNYYKIELQENVEKLNEVVLTAGENPALAIIRRAIENRDANNPEKTLESFKFNAYSKLLVTANPDSLNGSIDSIFKKKDGKLEFVKVDSSNFELKKQLNRSHLYMTEKVSEYAFTREKGKRETILASRLAGFKQPIYEILSLQIQSFSFYEEKYTLFGTDYINPLARNALKTYNYRILDTLPQQGRNGYMIYYFPKEKGKTAGLEGVLYIDEESHALQKAIAQLKGVIDVKATQHFTYFTNEKLWFPLEKEVKIKKGESQEAIAMFGGSVRFNAGDGQKDSTLVRSNPDNPEEIIYLISREQNFDVLLNQPVTIKGRGLSIVIDEKASTRDEGFWNQFRTDSIGSRGRETYVYMDSIVAANKVEKRLATGRKLLIGYLPVGYLDLDLRYLLKYNNFEGFRLGMGAVTNGNFSTKYRLNGYGVYGTKDKDFKYGLGAAARLDLYTDTWLGINYFDDLIETGSSKFITDGRAFSLFEPRLFNISLFHKTKSLSTFITHDITPKLSSKLELDRTDIAPTYPYQFLRNGESFSRYKINTATLGLQFNPFSTFMQTKDGKQTIKNKFPQFTLQLTQSFENVLDGDFNFTKADFRVLHEFQPLNQAKTTLMLMGGIGFGDIPLTHLYHASPNQPNGDLFWQRFSVAGRDSFETMFFNEFFSDKYLMAQIKKYFKRFSITNKIRPEVVLITRYAIGDIENPEDHVGINFNSLRNGYYESGLELNKIFWGFGLSGMYRYGAYHLPKFEDNISFKFTYYLNLGF